jgi:SAM-dependent methyltransferase
MSKKQNTHIYNTKAHQLKQKFSGMDVRKEDVERGLSLCTQKENPFVFEIGCAYGREAGEIVRHTNRYLGIDIAENFIKIAREDVPEARFEVGDIEVDALPSGIDLIFAFASLLHTPSDRMKDVLMRAQKALNPEGIFYISLKLGEYKEFTKTDEFGERVFYHYLPKDIIELAGEGYEVVYEDEQDLREQKWFTVALKKK